MTFVNKRKAVITVILAVVLAVLVVFLFAYDRIIPAENRDDKPYYPRLKFSISLLDQLQKDNPNENIFYSPHSVYSTLLLAYLGAKRTQKTIRLRSG